jgi:hypothetical protein
VGICCFGAITLVSLALNGWNAIVVVFIKFLFLALIIAHESGLLEKTMYQKYG